MKINMMKQNMKEIREKRRNRVMDAITSQLGSDPKPPTLSHRQASELNKVLNKQGSETMATVWVKALEIDSGKPGTIKHLSTASLLATSPYVSHPKQTVSPDVSPVSQTVSPDVSANVDAPTDAPLEPKDLSRILKLDCALIVLSDLGGILRTVRESGDLELMARFRTILNKLADLTDSRLDILTARAALNNQITDIEREEAA